MLSFCVAAESNIHFFRAIFTLWSIILFAGCVQNHSSMYSGVPGVSLARGQSQFVRTPWDVLD